MNKRKRFKKSKRVAKYKALNGRCAYCGQLISYKNMQLEHVQPLVQDGADKMKNILPSCKECNYMKGERNLEEFRFFLENAIYDVLDTVPEYVIAKKFGLIKSNEKNRSIKFYFETKNFKLDSDEQQGGV